MTQPTKTFNAFNLPANLLENLSRINFTNPTDIQEQTIPAVLSDRDIIGTAPTGTGKTGAFSIPLLAKILENDNLSLLVLVPTRELALQVVTVFQKLTPPKSSIKSALLIGGEFIEKQFKQLRAKPRIVVGTPGRINDHLKRKTLKLHTTQHLVLDETDVMLDMGFDVQIKTIIEKLPKKRQTLMFSATFPKRIESLAAQYLSSPLRINISGNTSTKKNIHQESLSISDKEKYNHLLDQLNKRDEAIIIFVKTKRSADNLAKKLNETAHSAQAIHGDLRQNKRDRVIKSFRNKKFRILVATDVAARGLDIPHINHVINYDLPQCPEDYTHRIGRTGRAGEKGFSLTFITNKDKQKWKKFKNLLKIAPKEINTLETADDKSSSLEKKKKTLNSRQKNTKKSFSEMSKRKSSSKRKKSSVKKNKLTIKSLKRTPHTKK